MLEDLSPATLSDWINLQFTVEQAGHPNLDLILTDIHEKPLAQLAPDRHLEQFSIVFEGPAETPLTQGIYTLRHPEKGKLELFLVPIGQSGPRLIYEAAFSRFIDSPDRRSAG